MHAWSDNGPASRDERPLAVQLTQVGADTAAAHATIRALDPIPKAG
jgi:hypothetical protein